jgi:hypothetical protein
MKILAPVASAIALGVGASAQFAGNEAGQVIQGHPVFEVSLENDIRDPFGSRGKIVLERPARAERRLVFKMMPRRDSEPRAIIPQADDMVVTLVLQGTPGTMGVIHLDTRVPDMRSGGGVRFTGLIEADGFLAIELPAGFDVRGLFAYEDDGRWVAHLGSRELVLKTGGAMAVGARQRPEMDVDVLNLEAASEAAYAEWYAYWTELQLRSRGALAGGNLAGDLLAAVAASNPLGGRRAGEKIVLQRIERSPVDGGGRVLPGPVVEDDISGPEQITEPADPKNGARRAGDKIALRRPARDGGHAQQVR